ncbi:MAG: hypothetical protein LIO55_05105 [Oscillospiraceae bacterium]|nr:hypothetical protein [Oscillospiraceae bacterium]
MALNAIRAKLNKLAAKADELESGDYYLPPIDTYAFQARLVWFEGADDVDGVWDELRHYHPKEIQQILDLNPDDWSDEDGNSAHGIPSSRNQIAHVQNLIREAQL